jgi:hypothetical protein
MIIYRLTVNAEMWYGCGKIPHDAEVNSNHAKLDILAKQRAVNFRKNDIQYEMRLQKLTIHALDKQRLMEAFRTEDMDTLVQEVEVIATYKSRARPPAPIGVPVGFGVKRTKVKSMKERRAAKATSKYRESKGGDVRPYKKRSKKA